MINGKHEREPQWDEGEGTTMELLELFPLSSPPSHVTHHVTSIGVSQYMRLP